MTKRNRIILRAVLGLVVVGALITLLTFIRKGNFHATITTPVTATINVIVTQNGQPFTGTLSFLNSSCSQDILTPLFNGLYRCRLSANSAGQLEISTLEINSTSGNTIVSFAGAPQTEPHNFSLTPNQVIALRIGLNSQNQVASLQQLVKGQLVDISQTGLVGATFAN